MLIGTFINCILYGVSAYNSAFVLIVLKRENAGNGYTGTKSVQTV